MNHPIVTVDAHPLLHLGTFVTELPVPLAELPSPAWLQGLLRLPPAEAAPLQADEFVSKTCRDLLRHGGFKPTGRSKPSSEYLLRAATEGTLSSINAVVDLGNAVSLHSGLPISVVDLDRVEAPLRVGIAEAGQRFVFNASGQEIDIGGLLNLFDAQGPCANPVKDAMRQKTHGGTRRTLTLLWGHRDLAARVDKAQRWYQELVVRLGASSSPIERSAAG